MKRPLLSRLLATFALVGLALSHLGAHPVLAGGGPALLGAPGTGKSDAPGPLELTFAEMHMPSPQALSGPVSEYSLRFNLPAGWIPAGSVSLDIDLSAFFSSVVPAENNPSISGLVGGNMSVSLNGSPLGMQTLQQSGDQTIHFEFDSALLTLPARGSSNDLRLRWDSTTSCLMNLSTSVTIMPTSKMKLSYAENSMSLTLNRFPAPFIIENSVRPVPLVVLLPVSPSLAETRAALIVAAGIGQLSGGTSVFKIESLSASAPAATDKNNVVLIATSEKLVTPEVKNLGLTARIQAAPGEGIVHLFQGGAAGYGLVVSGDEAGIIKAAQVVSVDLVIAAGDPGTMIVGAVNPTASPVAKADMTLQDLGVGEMLLTPETGLIQSFDFFIPAGQQVTPDSSFNLIISHSQQLDYLRSGLQVKLNGFPAASVRLNDSTANQTLFTLILPSNLIHAGRNTIEFIAGLNARDVCGPVDAKVAWLRVSANSVLHLPLEPAVIGSAVAKVFNDFPDAFLSGSGLDNVTFLLPRADLDSWRAAGILAFQLGKALPQSQLLGLRLAWSDAVDPTLTRGANLILVGKPSDFKTLADKDQFPSLVFAPDNTLTSKSALTVVPEPVAGADVGYLAVRGFASATDRILLAVLGNSSAGIKLALDALASPTVRTSNFAVVAGEGVQASWLDPGISGAEVAQSPSLSTEVPAAGNAGQQYKQGLLPWVVPIMAGLLVVLIILVYIELRRNSGRDR